MQVPDNVRLAVLASTNAADVEQQAKRRWAEAVAAARWTWKRVLSERERLGMDVMCCEFASSGRWTRADARNFADLANRCGTADECAFWVRVHTKLVNRRAK